MYFTVILCSIGGFSSSLFPCLPLGASGPLALVRAARAELLSFSELTFTSRIPRCRCAGVCPSLLFFPFPRPNYTPQPDGTKPVRTEPTCPSARLSAFLLITVTPMPPRTSGLSVSSTLRELAVARSVLLADPTPRRPYIASAALGCWLCDPVNNWLGRRGAIFISAIFCLFPVIAQGLCQTWVQLTMCRLLLGIGMGMKASSIPIFAAENTPASIRGGLVMSWQLYGGCCWSPGRVEKLTIARFPAGPPSEFFL